ncbi:MAG: hypothetical protein IPP14_05830 [Planctomycetes bacterium]|nr:hypothetical protein [Planctomycetota bacterium]
MIKLCASYGLKVPAQQEYSSESFHASAEVELADGTSGTEGLGKALNRLWADLKQAVNAEIAKGAAKVPAVEPANAHPAPAKGNGYHDNGHTGNNGHTQPVNRVAAATRGDAATKKQVSFLFALARRHRNFSADQTRQWVQAEFGQSINDLGKADAARIIDSLSGK